MNLLFYLLGKRKQQNKHRKGSSLHLVGKACSMTLALLPVSASSNALWAHWTNCMASLNYVHIVSWLSIVHSTTDYVLFSVYSTIIVMKAHVNRILIFI